jgi:hypothetical protein
MTSHLIIDGYNLLGARGQVGSVGGSDPDSARERLLRDLAAYRQRKAYAITVVFDGWRQSLGAEGHEHRAGVEVIFSRRGERADQVIQRLAADYGGACAVVSSDHEVRDSARHAGAIVIGASEFDARLHAALAAGSGAGMKLRDRDDEEPMKRPSDKKGNAKKLPKALRQRRRQLRRF